jgi:DNA-binding MarR family transcriptional regulator
MIDFLSSNDSRPNVKGTGLGLVEKYTDPSNGRRFLLRLTVQGEHFIQQIKDTVC